MSGKSYLDEIKPPAEESDVVEARDGRFNAKSQQFSVAFYTDDKKVRVAQYCHFLGGPEPNAWEKCTEIKVWFQGVVGGIDGQWECTIRGVNLDKVFGELAEGRRISVRPTTSAVDDRWVKSVTVRPFEPEEQE